MMWCHPPFAHARLPSLPPSARQGAGISFVDRGVSLPQVESSPARIAGTNTTKINKADDY
eukprot:scaffold309_cov235-Pinguiococcus_pyrenoidosus.AAC.12